MKKLALPLSVMLIVGIVLSACSTDNIDPMSESGSTTLPGTAISAPQVPSLSESEAVTISMDLYENGYCPFISFLWGFGWGSGVDWEQSFSMDDIVKDMRYYRSTLYRSRAHLEEELGKTFTMAFVQRNVTEFFEGDANGHIMLVERDGVLYRREADGMGGTYKLATETVKIENMSVEGWTFTMYGLDSIDDSPDEDLVWTFSVTNENGYWLIDSMEGV